MKEYGPAMDRTILFREGFSFEQKFSSAGAYPSIVISRSSKAAFTFSQLAIFSLRA